MTLVIRAADALETGAVAGQVQVNIVGVVAGSASRKARCWSHAVERAADRATAEDGVVGALGQVLSAANT